MFVIYPYTSIDKTLDLFPVPNRVFVLQKGIEKRLAEIVYFGNCVYTTFMRTVKSEIGGVLRATKFGRLSAVVVVCMSLFRSTAPL